MKNILLFVIFFLISKTFSQNLVYPIGYETHMDSLVVKYKESDIYYTNISFIWKYKSRLDMSFNCVLNDKIRICTLPVKESDREEMYSEDILACTARNGEFVMCGFEVHLGFFPSPLLISPFKPKTRGGNTTLSGYYLELEERVFVIFKNNYQQDQYYGSNNFYKVVGYFQTKTPDRINLKLRVYPGCGNRTIIWENGETYNFTYQDPNIEKIDINESVLNITGTNFYNQSVFVAVKIDNNIIDPNDIISVDFENIKLKFNYSDPFSSKLNVQVSCCDYWSNKFQITYPPIPSSVNSIPKLKGGLLIINGNRLTSSPSSNNNNNNISVTVANSICSIVSSSSNEIKCNLQPLSNSTLNNLQPLSNSTLNNSSPITISINGVENTNKLLLNYDVPHIKTYSQVNDEIHIIGSCLGNINSTHIQINGKQVSNQIKSINNDETVLILKVQNQIYNFNISIESNSIKSNSINVDVKLYAKINEIPLVSIKLINFTLFYVNSGNINSIATIKILNEQPNQTIKSTLTNIKESVVSCSFLIENLCGIVNYEIEIGNQRYQSSFSYESPLINKCNLNSNEIVTCIGKGFVNSNETIIIISNQSIAFNNESSNNNNDKSISFQMNEEYNILGELYLNVCGLLSNKVTINTIPIFKNVSIPNLFDTNGGNIVIIGKYLNNNTTNITIECNNQVIEKECKLNNSSISLECNIRFNGPNDKTCKLLFNNNIVSTFNIIYKSPSINQTSIVNLKQGGTLTIIGNDFYYPIDKVIIIDSVNGRDSLNCNEAKYINDTMITCFIQATNNTFDNIKNGEMIFIKVTTNGKSGISKVFKYLTQSDDSHQYSDARNIFQNLLLSILIILIISLLFISNI
ncbi:hypothetical protein ACTFIW_009170 [Dictyostelium discoideum]